MQRTYSNTVSATLTVAVYAHGVFDNCFATSDLFSYRVGEKKNQRDQGTGNMKYPDPAVINYVCIVLKSF